MFRGKSFSIYHLILCNQLSVTLVFCAQATLDGLVTLVFNQLEHLEVCLCTVLFSSQLVQLFNASSKLKRVDISLMDVSFFVNSIFFRV